MSTGSGSGEDWRATTLAKRLPASTWPVQRFPGKCSHVKCLVAFPFQSYHGTREHGAGIPNYHRKNLEIVRD